MKIKNIHFSYKNNTAFKSGLSNSDLKKFQEISPHEVEKYLYENYKIDSKFKDNQTFSILNLVCAQILNKINIPFNPSQIRVFDKKELIKNCPDSFCIATSRKILKNEPVFRPKSIFFKNYNMPLSDMNKMAQNAKTQNYISNDKFITFAMHEWAHSVHLEYLYKIAGNDEKKVLEYIKKLKTLEFSEREKETIRSQLGQYVYNGGKINPLEVFAEGLNKTVSYCISDEKMEITDDFNSAKKKMPPELVEILEKILIFPHHHFNY